MKKVIIISGFSGVGKGTIVNRLMKQDTTIRLSISETNRKRRNDTDRYYFITSDEFQKNIIDGKYLEYNQYGKHYYGTPKQPVFDAVNEGEGCPIILEIDIHGLRQVHQNQELKNLGTEIISVMLVADATTLQERLINRGDSKEEIFKRLNIALEESKYVKEYNHVIVNHTVENTTEQLYALLHGQEILQEKFDIEKFQQEMTSIIAVFDLNQ